jgi:hypothetical protein
MGNCNLCGLVPYAVVFCGCPDAKNLQLIAIARRPMRSTWPITAYARKSTARSQKVSRCPGAPPGQGPQVGGACGGRTRLRPPEGSDGPLYPHHRPRPSKNQIGLANLVYNMNGLAHRADRASLSDEAVTGLVRTRWPIPPTDSRLQPCSRIHRSCRVENPVFGSVQLAASIRSERSHSARWLLR